MHSTLSLGHELVADGDTASQRLSARLSTVTTPAPPSTEQDGEGEEVSCVFYFPPPTVASLPHIHVHHHTNTPLPFPPPPAHLAPWRCFALPTSQEREEEGAEAAGGSAVEGRAAGARRAHAEE